ncbi:MAG: aldo/keto reductase [bacterium]
MDEISEKVRLGKSNLEITTLGFGAWAIGSRGYGEVPDQKARKALQTYLDAGGNFIDTATRYGNSEEIIGRVLEKDTYSRPEVIIASKTPELEPDKIREEVEESLKRLRTDYVDLYYLHAPPEDKDTMNRILDEFMKLKEEGKILSIGASIKGPNVTEKTVKLCQQYIKTEKVDVLQVIFSIFRQKNRDMFDLADSYDVGIVGRTALESGFLTGKYRPGYRFSEDDHRKRWGQSKLDNILQIVKNLEEEFVQPPYDQLSEVAVKFALDEAGIDSVIVGAKNRKQVQANIRATNLPSLTKEKRIKLVEEFSGREEEFNTVQ